MREVFLVFRLAYIMDATTLVPVFVKEFDHRDEAAQHIKEKGGFIFPALVPPSRDLRGSPPDRMMLSEMGENHE